MLVRTEATGSLIRCWKGCKMVQTLWKSIWQFLINLNIYHLTQHSHSWVCTAEKWTLKLTCTSVQGRFCRSIHNYRTVETTSHPSQADGLTSWDGTTLLSNNNGWAIESCKQVHLRGAMLGERSQPQKNTDQMTPFIQHLCKGSTMVMENWAVVSRWTVGWREGILGVTAPPRLQCIAQIYTHIKTHTTGHQVSPFASTFI